MILKPPLHTPTTANYPLAAWTILWFLHGVFADDALIDVGDFVKYITSLSKSLHIIQNLVKLVHYATPLTGWHLHFIFRACEINFAFAQSGLAEEPTSFV